MRLSGTARFEAWMQGVNIRTIYRRRRQPRGMIMRG